MSHSRESLVNAFTQQPLKISTSQMQPSDTDIGAYISTPLVATQKWRVKWCRYTLFNFYATYDPTFERSFCMGDMVGKFWKCRFTCNKQGIFWTSELGVMTNLVEDAHAAWWLRENCKRLHKAPPRWPLACYYYCSFSHLSMRGVPIIYTHVLHHLKQGWLKNF
jgi:hypothetical protein